MPVNGPNARPRLSCAAFGVLVLAGLAVAPPARATDPFEACVSAYDQAQVDRRAGKLVAARQRLLVCSQAACPAAARRDCAQWLEEVEISTPTIVIDARTRSGAELVDVRVIVDRQELTRRLEGKALPVDPGTHKFVFEIEGAPSVEQVYTIREGEKNRRIQVELAPKQPADDSATTTRPIPPLAFVLGGVGLVGIAGFAFFGISAKNDEAALRDQDCEPNCPVEEVDAVFEKMVVADVSLGVGLAALTAATIVFLTRPTVSGRAPQPAAGRRPGITITF